MADLDSRIKYRRKFLPTAKKIMQDGGVYQDLADKFGVSLGTIRNWLVTHPEFREAMLAGKDEFDVETIEPLLLDAIMPRTEKTETTVTEAGLPVKVTTKIQKMLGNPGLMMKWLALRGGERWKDIQRVEVTDGDGLGERLRKAMSEARKTKEDSTKGKKLF